MSMVTAQPKTTYEQLRPLIVWLGLTELAWITYWLQSVDHASLQYLWIIAVWVVFMLFWMGGVILASKRGFFLRRTRYLSNFVGATIVLTFAFLLFGIVPVAREGLLEAVRNTSDIQLISIHILRLLAIGGVIKYLQGELPRHFAVIAAIPDLFFGISAVAVMALAANGSVGFDFLVIWHLLGFSVLLGAGVSMFFSVQSPLQIFHGKPDTSITFQFPMVLAPNFTVPLFMIAHVIALVKLFTI